MDKSNLAAWGIVKIAIHDYSQRFRSNASEASVEELPHQPREVHITVKSKPELYPPTSDRTAAIEFDGNEIITVQKSLGGKFKQFRIIMKEGKVVLRDQATWTSYYVDEFCRYALAGVLFPEP